MSRMRDIETINVPRPFTDLARRRTDGIVKASIHYPNIIETIALSCYLQGLEDGYETAKRADTGKDGGR